MSKAVWIQSFAAEKGKIVMHAHERRSKSLSRFGSGLADKYPWPTAKLLGQRVRRAMDDRDRNRKPQGWKQLGGPVASRSNQLALWSAANLAGMTTRRLRVREPFFLRLINLFVGKRRQPRFRTRRPSPERSLPLLAETLVGTTKSTIACVFGPPRSAFLNEPRSIAGASFWQAEVWYYPLPRNGPLAAAITFDDDYAARVEFFEVPAATCMSISQQI